MIFQYYVLRMNTHKRGYIHKVEYAYTPQTHNGKKNLVLIKLIVFHVFYDSI